MKPPILATIDADTQKKKIELYMYIQTRAFYTLIYKCYLRFDLHTKKLKTFIDILNRKRRSFYQSTFFHYNVKGIVTIAFLILQYLVTK